MDDLNISLDYGPIVRNALRLDAPKAMQAAVCDTLRAFYPNKDPDTVAGLLEVSASSFDERGFGSSYTDNLRDFARILRSYAQIPAYRILVISTASILTPPERYGGMERMAAYLAEAFSQLGQDVGVIAKTGSSAPNLVGHGKDEKEFPSIAKPILSNYDIVVDLSHDKMVGQAFPDFPQLNTYQVMSVAWKRNPVFISEAQRDYLGIPGPVVYYGLRLEDYPIGYRKREPYILYMGSIIQEKRVEWAVKVAALLGVKIKLAGPSWTPKYFNEVIKPLTQARGVEYVGDVGGQEKLDLLQNAMALIHPVGGSGWVEAGAIIVQEALATGTPVIGSRNGCLPEYIDSGVNGVLGDTPEEMAEAYATSGLAYRDSSPWAACRASIAGLNWIGMARNYINMVHEVLDHKIEW